MPSPTSHPFPCTTLFRSNLGTPGGPNSRASANVGPAITDVRHDPALPAATQPVLVSARVNDPDGIAFLAVNYRIDPATNYLTLDRKSTRLNSSHLGISYAVTHISPLSLHDALPI